MEGATRQTIRVYYPTKARAQHVRRWLGLFVATIGFAWLIGALVTPFGPVVLVRWTPNLDAPLQAKTERDLGLVRGIQIVGEDHTWRYQLRSGDADTLARLVNHPAVEDTNGFERSEPQALIFESVPLAIPLILSLWVSLVLCRVDFSPRSVGVVAQPAPSHEVLAARPTQLFATHENVKVFALLFVVAMSMVAATYWRVYLNPNPAWPANDDAWMFSELGRFLSGGLSFRDYILTAHGDSLVPLLRVVYWGFASVSSDWPPSWSHFGYAFILITALSIASSGFLVWYFGRNLVVAGSVVLFRCRLRPGPAEWLVYFNIVATTLFSRPLPSVFLSFSDTSSVASRQFHWVCAWSCRRRRSHQGFF